MDALPETSDLEVILRFLHRFADLMSNGSNSENLLRAATLLEANVKRANEAEKQLRQARSNNASIEQQLAALSREGHVHVPISILKLAASHHIDLDESSAYSDSATDIPMLEVVGHPVVVNPDRALAKEAKERGWEVLSFTSPVRLRDRAAVRLPAMTGAVVVVALLFAGLGRTRRAAA